MKRRCAAAACVMAFVVSRGSAAQQPERVRRIGWLGNSAPVTAEGIAVWDAFRLELRRLGWIEGRNLAFERRFAEGDVDRIPLLARELIDRKVDLIVAVNGPAARAAQQATATLPIVFASVTNPVEQGLVATLARPAGNLTGMATQGDETVGKRLQLLKEMLPRTLRIAVLADASDTGAALLGAAAALGIELLMARASRAEDLPAAIASGARSDAWFITDQALYFAQRKTVVELIAQQRRPAIYPQAVYVHAGGLASYSVDLKDHFRRAAGVVDKVLRGARPADIPVEQPTRFELTINLETAADLGLKIPQSVLLRADEVIE